MNPDNVVTRREMLEGTALALFALKAAPDLLSSYTPKFFSNEDFSALQAFTFLLIPTDENPGAREAKCAEFIDFVLVSSDEMPQTQSTWRKAMEALREAGFHRADANHRLDLISEMSQAESPGGAHHPAYFAYRLIKQQTAFAFYTSKEGQIETLDYKGNSYNAIFPACTHPEHQTV